MKGIVELVLKYYEGKHDAGDANQATDGTSTRNSSAPSGGDVGKLFHGTNADTGANAKKSAADAAKAVGAVSGADILQAMVKDSSKEITLAKSTDGNAGAAPTDGEVAGAMALRAIAKDGKFANGHDGDASAEIKRAAVSAVTKALDTLTIAIRKTIDEGLKKVKEAMNINANDNPVTSETGVAAK